MQWFSPGWISHGTHPSRTRYYIIDISVNLFVNFIIISCLSISILFLFAALKYYYFKYLLTCILVIFPLSCRYLMCLGGSLLSGSLNPVCLYEPFRSVLWVLYITPCSTLYVDRFDWGFIYLFILASVHHWWYIRFENTLEFTAYKEGHAGPLWTYRGGHLTITSLQWYV